mgnify:CR=1 FL=1
MSIFTETQAKAILDKVIKLSKADECVATLEGSVAGNIRYALNSVSTSGIVSNCELAVQVAFGKKVGTATINEFDDAALARVVKRAEDLARLAPDNPEFIPAIGKQEYLATPTFAEATAGITPEYRAQVAADSASGCGTSFSVTPRAGMPILPGLVHRFSSPRRHTTHTPHPIHGWISRTSPTLTPVASGPTATTSPTFSWPMVSGSFTPRSCSLSFCPPPIS